MPKPEREPQPLRHQDEDNFRYNFDGDPNTPPPPTANTYRIANYVDGLVGASPECDILAPHFDDDGLTWPDDDIDRPEDWLMDGGVLGGILWDGTFYRDTARLPAFAPGATASSRPELFWCSYFKPGTEPGIKKGYWINFGSGWSHLHNDDPAQILTGASQKLFWEPGATASSRQGRQDAAPPAGVWKLVIEATKFVTHEVINVWTGTKSGGNDPTGTYTRLTGLDPVATLSVEAVP